MKTETTQDLRIGSAARLPGLRIGTNYVVAAARRQPERNQRAMRWAANYAILRQIDSAELAEEIGIEERALNIALTNQGADISEFVSKVEVFRSKFENRLSSQSAHGEGADNPFPRKSAHGEAFGTLANTRVLRDVRRAIKMAINSGEMVEVIGLERTGKTVSGANTHLLHLDDALWLHCPSSTSERDFLLAFATSVGVTARNNSLSGSAIRAKIEEVFERGGFKCVIVNEAHYIWHRANKGVPCRLEFLRYLQERYGVGIVLLATPQFTDLLADSFAHGNRWAPGQYDGRAQAMHLPDLSDHDLAAIARHHAPDFEPELIAQLVEQAKATAGFAGAMVNAIRRARVAFEEAPNEDRMKLLQVAQAKLAKGRRMELLAAGKIVPMERKQARRVA